MNEKIARLYEAVEKLEGIKGQSSLVRFLNTSPQILNNWESHGALSKGPVEATKAIGTSVEWFETGTGSIDGLYTPESDATAIDTVDAQDSRTPLSGNDCEVPFYKNIHLAVDNGFSDDIEDYNGYKLCFSKAAFRRRGISPATMICVYTDGDGMEPVFLDDATLGINTADKTVKDGKIYTVNHDGLLHTKILQRLSDNKMRVGSYNAEACPDKEADATDINIIGRVFWWSVVD